MLSNRYLLGTIYVLAALGGLVIIAGFSLSFTHQTFRIPTGAMHPALRIGDHLYAKKIGDNFQPQVGDILIFDYPKNPEISYIKRCVALAGDSVEVREGILYVNGEIYESNFADPEGDHSCIPGWEGEGDCPDPSSYRLRETFLQSKRNREWPPDGIPETYIVPEGHIFMMGDNRYNSADSRHWGALDTRLIVAKASFFYWSSEDPGRIGKKVR